MKIKINWLGVAVIIAVVINIIDLVSAKRILVGEANPLYVAFKSYGVLILAKVVFVGVILFIYRNIKNCKYTNKASFFFCMVIIYSIIAVGIGAFSNLSVSDERLEQVEVMVMDLENKSEQGDLEATQQLEKFEESKISEYTKLVWFLVYFPIIFGFISFCLYESSKGYFNNQRNDKKTKEEK